MQNSIWNLKLQGLQTITDPNSSFPFLVIDKNTNESISQCKVSATSHVKINGYALQPRLANHQFIDDEIVLEAENPVCRMECSRKKTSVCRIWPSEPNKGHRMFFLLWKNIYPALIKRLAHGLMFTKSPRMDGGQVAGLSSCVAIDRRKTSSYENGA